VGDAGITGSALKTQILSLLALQPAVSVIELAWSAAARLVHGESEQVRASRTLIANGPTKYKIISFHLELTPLNRTRGLLK
jgi:hypothetical protein